MDPAKAQKTLEDCAEYICNHREQITQEWVAAVASDGRLLASERLKAEELKDYLPDLFDNLAGLLRFPANADVRDKADQNARIHGSHRFGQGYRLDELLREIARVRSVLLTHVLAFEEQTPAFSGVVKRVVLQRLQAFFDELMCDAAAQFVRDQQAGLREDLVEAQEAGEEAEMERQTATAETELLRGVDKSRLRLLRNVAHELSNSLNATQLIARELESEGDEARRWERTSMLTRNIQHMSALLNDLLEYSTLIEGQKPLRIGPVSMAELNEDLVATYKALAEAKGLRFESDYDPALISVLSHRSKLVQIATNLLSNAVKYTSKGYVHFWIRGIDEQRWSLGVEDTGSGIAAEERSQLFTEFHRAKETANAEGTGLGLAIVSRLVKLLGGEILVQSELGKGSRFEVVLPRASEAAR
ncbi:sensor histidine kinase [Verrucomicrobiota bacterium sgz303538]